MSAIERAFSCLQLFTDLMSWPIAEFPYRVIDSVETEKSDTQKQDVMDAIIFSAFFCLPDRNSDASLSFRQEDSR